ncbi:aspartate dehydrogenase [Cupriavidus pinatubonensis]|uniref:aspartate dehydrogenase n=1 Tax=Cupriavidus pinatubonensis TaxID=248026 RepID=UPI001FD02C48|nr:aspartate dehydrogenase [Cupriavidus pinatubonensis]
MIGFGAIGQEVVHLLGTDQRLAVAQIVVPPTAVAETRVVAARLAPQALVDSQLDFRETHRPDLVVECAGHGAVHNHVLPALRFGIPCIVASVGVLHDTSTFEKLDAAAQEGRTCVRLIPGAIGAIDALAAASIGGLLSVTYVGRKAPRSWVGTPAEQVCDLTAIDSPHEIFSGTAREAASHFPLNANVAATVAIAGLGLDKTMVKLVADPNVDRNVHTVYASGTFGRFEISIENRPLPGNPKTSALAAYSLAKAVRDACSTIVM